MLKTKQETQHKPNHKKEQKNFQNSNPPSAVGFTHSGDEAPLEIKQIVNKEKGNSKQRKR
jgi:hypothetical protein